MNRNLSIVVLVIAIGIAAYVFLTNTSSSPQLGSLEESTEIKTKDSPKEETIKTDLDKVIEIGEKLVEGKEKWSENKLKKDSIKRANRQEFLVYQIGMPKSSPEELWDTYKKLRGFGNVCLLKATKHSYYLIKHEGYNKEQMADHETAAKEYLESVDVSEEIKIVDLASLCAGDEEAKMGKSEKVNKEKITCYICR